MQDLPGALESTPTYSSKAASIKTMRVLQKMGMDFIGLFPKSKQGHVYALVMQDYFTKWPKAIPLKDVTARTSSRTPQLSGPRKDNWDVCLPLLQQDEPAQVYRAHFL